MAENAEIPISESDIKIAPSNGASSRRHKDSGGTIEGKLLVGGAKVALKGGKLGFKAGRGLGKFAIKETAKTIWQGWKNRKDIAKYSTGALAATIAFHPNQTVDITKDVAKGFSEQIPRVLQLDHKMPSEVEMDKLTGKENGQVDFFELTFPWLNESEKLQVRTLADNEKTFLKENYPPESTQRVYELTPLIKATAERYGVPFSYLRAIAFVESGGDPSARNEVSGAAGLTQILEKTAISMGYTADDRYDPGKNLEMEALYLRDFHKQTGLWSEDVVIFHTGAGNWDFLKRTAFENRGIAIPTVVTDDDAALNAKIQRESTFHNKIGPIQVILDSEVQQIIADDSWNNHGKYLLRVFAAEELVHEYELAQQHQVAMGQ